MNSPYGRSGRSTRSAGTVGQWTNLSISIRLDRDVSRSLGGQIEDQLRETIRIGGIPPGMALPPSRRLAAELRVSRGVVVAAYSQLCAEGLLTARSGADTTVTERGRDMASRDLVRDAPKRPRRVWRHDLNPEVPDIATFPRSAWGASLQVGLSTLPTHGFDYRALRGLPALREALSAFLARSRGVRAEPDEIVLCGGYRQALAVLMLALREAGDHRCVAVARVGHAVNRHLLSEAAMPTQWLDVDDGGIVVDHVLGREDTVVMVNPIHQFPLGTALASDRLEALRESNLLIIEDDSNSHLQHDGAYQPALQGERRDRTIYMGSLSRSLAPGVRLGFIVAPPEIARAAGRTVGLWGLAPSPLEQAAVADFIARGGLDLHLRSLRASYRRRARELRAAFSRELPHLALSTPNSGFHAVLHLGGAADEGAVVTEAAARDIRLYGMQRHVHAGPPLPPAVVLGYGTVSRAVLPTLVGELAQVVGAPKRPCPDDLPAPHGRHPREFGGPAGHGA